MTQKKHNLNKPARAGDPREDRVTMTSSQEVKSFGLLAIGSTHDWDISIDESVQGDQKWYAQIEGPSVSIYFQLIDLGIVPRAIDFLGRRDSNPRASRTKSKDESDDELTIGLFDRASVSLVWDNECKDRCFLVIGPKSRSSIRLTLFGKDIKLIQQALGQLSEDLAAGEVG